jgi:hypothetical protein
MPTADDSPTTVAAPRRGVSRPSVVPSRACASTRAHANWRLAPVDACALAYIIVRSERGQTQSDGAHAYDRARHHL